jgi:hypothetical protein
MSCAAKRLESFDIVSPRFGFWGGGAALGAYLPKKKALHRMQRAVF